MVSENNKIGLVPAILMVAGNMMGSGVFMQMCIRDSVKPVDGKAELGKPDFYPVADKAVVFNQKNTHIRPFQLIISK